MANEKRQTSLIASSGPAGFTANDLIEETTAEGGTFDIPLKTGRVVKVKRVTDYQTLVDLRKRAAKIFRSSVNKTVPVAWKPYLPITEEVAGMVADITGLVVEPKFNDLDALRLCHECGPTAIYFHGLIKKSWQDSVPAAELEELEEEKND